MQMTKKEIMNLYELAVNEHHYYLDRHQTRASYFTNLLSAMMTATILGVFQAVEKYHLIILMIGPILICAVAQIGIDTSRRNYRVFLEAITSRAKLEILLGLTSEQRADSAENEPWASESIIFPRHEQNRKKYATSSEFVIGESRKGLDANSTSVYRVFQLISLLLLIGLVAIVFF